MPYHEFTKNLVCIFTRNPAPVYKKPRTNSQITLHQFTRNPAPNSQGGDVRFWLTSAPRCQPKGYTFPANHPLTLVALLRTLHFPANSGKQAVLNLTQHYRCKRSSRLYRTNNTYFCRKWSISVQKSLPNPALAPPDALLNIFRK